MLAKRIIPCLDIKNRRVVKGIKFKSLKDAGDPVQLSKYYSDTGADELVFLDISATVEASALLPDLVSSIASEINIPFTVGGGIKSMRDIELLLSAGADKVSMNTTAFMNPEIIKNASERYGKQCVVVAIDAKMIGGEWIVHLSGGTKSTGVELTEWASQAQLLGAGEILFTSMNNDGGKKGFATDALAELSQILNIPVIASGGAGSLEHFKDAFCVGKADAALAASVFHYGEIPIRQLKEYLMENGIEVRL